MSEAMGADNEAMGADNEICMTKQERYVILHLSLFKRSVQDEKSITETQRRSISW